jgi:hypothetical protein
MTMADTTTVTLEMTLEQFYPAKPGAPAAILLSRRSLTPSGARRPVSMKVFVRDGDLYQCLLTEVCEGDAVRVTTETDWEALDRGPTLTAFEKVEAREPLVRVVAPRG